MEMNMNFKKKNSGDEFFESRYGQHLLEEILLKEVEDRKVEDLLEEYLREQEILQAEADEWLEEKKKEERRRRRRRRRGRRVRGIKKNKKNFRYKLKKKYYYNSKINLNKFLIK